MLWKSVYLGSRYKVCKIFNFTIKVTLFNTKAYRIKAFLRFSGKDL